MPGRAITSQVDLLGRVTSDTDVHGTRTEPVYDRAGRMAAETVTPPVAADPLQTTTFTYDDASRVVATALDSATLAASSYDTAGEIATINYSNGTSLSALKRATWELIALD